MTNQERIYDGLNSAVGAWSPPNAETTIDFPNEEPLPWSSIDENSCPAEPIKPGRDRSDTSQLDEDYVDADGNVLGGAVQIHGFEALAFYKSFRFRAHVPYPGKWGIFYLAQGLVLVDRLIGIYAPIRRTDSNRLGLEFLRRHETYHYLVDILALGIEPPLAKHLYLPFRHAYRHCASHCVEEALANSRVWQWAIKQEKGSPGVSLFAEEFMNGQPNAYRRFKADPVTLNTELAANLVDQRVGRTSNANLETWMSSFPLNLASRWIPEFVIRGADVGRLFPAVQVLPPVLVIVDGPKVKKRLKRPGEGLAEKWKRTKDKLRTCSSLGGLDFGKWPKVPGTWSVRVDSGYRAHLKQLTTKAGAWEAIKIGTHDEMGH